MDDITDKDPCTRSRVPVRHWNSKRPHRLNMSANRDNGVKTGSGESRMSNKEVGHFKPRYLQHVGKELYLFDSVLNGNTYVHVRELKNERATPTRNGVTLTLQRCNELYSIVPEITIRIDQLRRNEPTLYRRHIGGNWFVTMETGFNTVDIRKFWLPDNETSIRATRKGVSLTFNQFDELKNGLRTIEGFVPELNRVVPCYLTGNHHRDLCRECSPNNTNIA